MKKSACVCTGAAAGLLNGLLGAGGGMLVVPMLGRGGLTADQAHATSIAITLPLSLLSGALYLFNGQLALSDALIWLPGGLAGAALGGWLLPRIRSIWLHRLFGVFALWSAVRLLWP